jgi:SAM-dependent methyltransferase
MLSFLCNICSEANTVATLDYERSSCVACGSNVRLRALVCMLSKELFGDGLALNDFPVLPGVKVLGLSDQQSYAGLLEKKFDYTNTFYDREPRLDITEPHPDLYGTYDFIFSSDVFEHVAPPVEHVFREVYKLLKPHGVLCLSVPFSLNDRTIERFPELHEYAVVNLAGSAVLINRSADGKLQILDDLIFHGGVGATLEMRLFSQRDLKRELLDAGFREVLFQTEPVPRFGISFEGEWSLPLVARKNEFMFEKHTVGQFALEYCARIAELTNLRRECDSLVARLEQRNHQVDRLESELSDRGVWGVKLQEDIERAWQDLARVQADFEERTKWALQLRNEAETEARIAAELRDQLNSIAESRWIKLGNKFGLGPKLCKQL